MNKPVDTQRKYSLEEYAELCTSSEEMFEYRAGQIVSMTARKVSQGFIATNLTGCLHNHLKDHPFRVFGIGTAIKTTRAVPFRLPRLTVIAGEPQIENFHDIEMLLNPLLIGEVYSPENASYDREEKFLVYQAIESFKEYLLVERDRPHVTRYVRQPDNQWLRADVIGLESSIRLESLDVTLSLSEIYWMIKFSVSEPPAPEPSN